MFSRILFSALLLVAPVLAADYDHSSTLGPQNGWLLIDGGGKIDPSVAAEFVRLAAGSQANFVVIPTASSDRQLAWHTPLLQALYSRLNPSFVPDNELRVEWVAHGFTNVFGASHVSVLHTRDRNRANSADFVEPLRHASGVWIWGGRQWRLADAYLGTSVEREIKALLARGGVVGGESAGATIQGSFLVRGAPGDQKNPERDNRIMMVPGQEDGFGLLENSAIDQHVIVRHREADLDPVIAAHPTLIGIGIDEEGAIVVHGNSFEVIGNRRVLIHDNKNHAGKRYYYLSPGQKFDLKTRRIINPITSIGKQGGRKAGLGQGSLRR